MVVRSLLLFPRIPKPCRSLRRRRLAGGPKGDKRLKEKRLPGPEQQASHHHGLSCFVACLYQLVGI